MIRLISGAPYSSGEFGRRAVVDQSHLLVMQIALLSGQEVPKHRANSNVHILVIEGTIALTLGGKTLEAEAGDLVPVPFRTEMSIRNPADTGASFLVIKTPHPREMEGTDRKG